VLLSAVQLADLASFDGAETLPAAALVGVRQQKKCVAVSVTHVETRFIQDCTGVNFYVRSRNLC
jgi:hypothetical protein